MKKLLIISTLALSLTPTFTQAFEVASCKTISELAYMVMQNRQYGSTLERQVEIAGESQAALKLALDAFDTRMYGPERLKEKASISFSNKYYAMCLRARMK